MKFLTVSLCSFLLLFATATFAQSKAQLAKMKQRVMTELSVDDAKADSVISIVQDFYTHARAVKMNSSLRDEDKKAALQNNRKQELARLRTHLNNEQIRKLQQLVMEMREERQHRKSTDAAGSDQ